MGEKARTLAATAFLYARAMRLAAAAAAAVLRPVLCLLPFSRPPATPPSPLPFLSLRRAREESDRRTGASPTTGEAQEPPPPARRSCATSSRRSCRRSTRRARRHRQQAGQHPRATRRREVAGTAPRAHAVQTCHDLPFSGALGSRRCSTSSASALNSSGGLRGAMPRPFSSSPRGAGRIHKRGSGNKSRRRSMGCKFV